MNQKIKFKFSKNDVAKSIISVLVVLISFILINLIVWAFKYGWISRYAALLDNKDWSTSISQMSISNPVAMFYDDSRLLENEVEVLMQDKDIIKKEETQEALEENTEKNIDKEDTSIDPYDPEFEDEFNSFFGWENSELNSIKDEELYNNLNDEASNNHNASEDNASTQDHSTIKRLIQKFNE